MSELGSGLGSSYPAGLDTNSTLEVNSPNAGKTLARAEVPNDLAAAIVAIETELGTDPAGTKTDVKTYLQVEHGVDGTHPLGTFVQMVSSLDGVVATGTTVMPYDDTIPQNTEGDQYYTLSITPKTSTNSLIIMGFLTAAHSVASTAVIAALFQDSTTDAIAADWDAVDSTNGITKISVIAKITAGGTSAITFKLRAGGHQAGTLTVNGASGARKLGGILRSGIVIYEVKA